MDRIPGIALLIGAIVFLPGFAQAQEKKPAEILNVTIKDLKENPEKYRGKVVEIEGTLKADPIASLRTQVIKYFLRLEDADDLPITSYAAPPDVVKGDKVRISGTFQYSQNGTNPVTMLLTIGKPHGKIEKLPMVKTPKP